MIANGEPSKRSRINENECLSNNKEKGECAKNVFDYKTSTRSKCTKCKSANGCVKCKGANVREYKVIV